MTDTTYSQACRWVADNVENVHRDHPTVKLVSFIYGRDINHVFNRIRERSEFKIVNGIKKRR